MNIARYLLTQGADLSFTPDISPLEYFTIKQDWEEIKYLVEKEVDIFSPRPGDNRNILNIAAMLSMKDAIDTLLKIGKTNKPPKITPTVLADAVRYADIETIKYLVEGKKADVNAYVDNKPIIYFAIMRQDTTIIEYLLEKGANINLPQVTVGIPLIWAIETKNLEVIEFILKIMNEKYKFSYKKYIYNDYMYKYVFSKYKDSELIKLKEVLAEGGIDINRVLLRRKQDSLMSAVKNNNIEKAKLIIGNNKLINVNQKVFSHQYNIKIKEYIYLLHYAVMNRNKEMVKLLIDAGANVNASSTRYNETPLHYAKDPGIIKLLIDAGANVNAGNIDGETPLCSAVYNNNLPAAKLLIKNGAEVNINIAISIENYDVCLLGVPFEYNRIDNNSVYIDIVSKNKNLNYYFKSIQWGSLLHWAVLLKNFELVKLLVENGADVNAIASTGETPLHYAVLVRDTQIINFLLQKGANPNISNNKGETPSDYAKKLNFNIKI